MTFEEVLRAVDQFSQDERQRLKQYLNHIEVAQSPELKAGTMNIDELLAGVDAMRRGLSDTDLDEIVAAMNEEYIETSDDSLWDN